MRRKPAPKSIKLSSVGPRHFDLGESSPTDDSSPEYSSNGSSHAGRTSYLRGTKELTADLDIDFSTNLIRNLSRRCSTFVEREHQHTSNSAGENNRPPSTSSRHKQQQTSSERGKRQADQTPKQRKIVGSRRKRIALNRDVRFWREVEALQKRTKNIIPLLPFSRLVRELMLQASTDVTKITPTALEALQTSTEMYITQRLQDAYLLTLHRGQVTLDVKDLRFLKFLGID